MNHSQATGWLRRDDGISSILGFIVAMVMLVASTATVAYFIASQPDPQGSEGSQELQSAATRAVSQLVSTTGQPADWHTTPSDLERAGLLKDGSQDVADLDKLKLLQDGTIDNEDLLDALDLRSRGYSVHATGQIHPNNLIRAPTHAGLSIVKGQDLDDPYIADADDLDAGSWGDLQKVCKYNTECAKTIHNWEFDWTEHPSTGLGDVVPDHPWWIETQFLPKLAGIRATYVQAPVANASIPDRDAQDSVFDDYNSGSGGGNKVTRWTIIQDNADLCLPDDGDLSANDHALLLGRMANKNDKCNEGDDHRDMLPGYRAWFLLGPYETSDADSLWLNFTNYLDINEGVDALGNSVHFVPRILFWNATKGTTGEWDRIRPSHQAGQADGCTSGWNDASPPEAKDWVDTSVNLCQALEDSLGEVWISVFWDSWCTDGSDNVVPCGECAGDFDCPSPNLWGIDDITIEGHVDGASHTFQNIALEATSRDLLTLSSGVSQALDERANGRLVADYRYPTRLWTRDLVKNGTNVLALEPGGAGDWLGGIGLEAQSATGAGDGAEAAAHSDHPFTKVPNALNETANGNGFATSAYAWSTGGTSMPVAGSPAPTNQLDAVHLSGGGTGAYGTVMVGSPYTDGGMVVAIAYNLSTLKADDPHLYDDFMVNMYSSMLFDDPSFELQGSQVPSDVSDPVATARRVVLVTVDDRDRFTLPLEITVYLWEQCIDSNLATDACD